MSFLKYFKSQLQQRCRGVLCSHLGELCKHGCCSCDWRSDLSHHQDIPKVWVSFESYSCHTNWQILLVTQRMNENECKETEKERGQTAIREINNSTSLWAVFTYIHTVNSVCVCVCVCVWAYTSHSPKTTIMNRVYTSVTSAVQRSQTWSILYYDFPPQRIFRRKETPSSHKYHFTGGETHRMHDQVPEVPMLTF